MIQRISALDPATRAAGVGLRPIQAPASQPVQAADRLEIQAISGTQAAYQTVQQLYLQEMAKIRQIGPLLESLPDFTITPLKVGIGVAQAQGKIYLPAGRLSVETPEGRIDLGRFESTQFEVLAGPQQFILMTPNQSFGPFQGKLIVENEADYFQFNGQNYRGQLEVISAPSDNQRLHFINAVLLEDYLKSVVPSESPASWPQESLRAQALAARTYAVASWQKRKEQGYDVNADTSDQVYKGMATENPATTQAVESTQGQIMVYQGRPITALFFSTSGGYTDSSAEVWNIPLPYIQPKPDFDWASPRYRWEKTYRASDLERALKNLGVEVGRLQAIQILNTTPQQRVKSLRVIGSQGEFTVDANAFRFAAGLNSTLWTVKAQGGQFTFSGGGWGHGLGMSQWGARQMAADGFAAEQIVKHYYTDIEILSLNSKAKSSLGI